LLLVFFISILVACLVGLVLYLSLVIICPCLPSEQQNFLASILSLFFSLLIACGVYFIIRPHIPATPQSLSLEASGAAVLGGLMVFSGVGVVAYLGDKIYRYKKRRKDALTKAPPKSNFDEDWKKELEKSGFSIITPEERTSFRMGPQVFGEEKEKQTSSGSNIVMEEKKTEEKKITLTVEDSQLGSVYNFTLTLSSQNYSDDNGFENFKSTAFRRCLTYNPDIITLDFRRADGSKIITDGKNFWDNVQVDDMLIATC